MKKYIIIQEIYPLRANISEADACIRFGGSKDLQIYICIRSKDRAESAGREDISTSRDTSVHEGAKSQAEVWPPASRKSRIEKHCSAFIA